MRNTMILAFLALICLPLAAQMSIAYVNVDSLLGNCNECKVAEQQYQTAVEQWDGELQAMATELDSLAGQLEMPLSDARKAEVQANFDEKKDRFEARQMEIYGQQGEAVRFNMELMMPLLELIQKAMEQYAADNNIDIIFDGETGEILYMKNTLEPIDSTGAILDFVNNAPAGQ